MSRPSPIVAWSPVWTMVLNNGARYSNSADGAFFSSAAGMLSAACRAMVIQATCGFFNFLCSEGDCERRTVTNDFYFILTVVVLD